MASKRQGFNQGQRWGTVQVRRISFPVHLAGGGSHQGFHPAFEQSFVVIKADYLPYGLLKRLAEQAVCEWIATDNLLDPDVEEKVVLWTHLN